METEIRILHQRCYGHLPSHLGQAPGRVEFLGGVTAPYQGLVLAAPVNRMVSVGISPRTDGKIELAWNGGRERCAFGLHTLSRGGDRSGEAGWFKTLLSQLQRRRVHFSGFSASLHDPLPSGLGLGSAAARSVAVALALRRQYPFTATELGADVPPRRDARGRLPPLTAKEKQILARWCCEAWSRCQEGDFEAFDPLPTLMGKAWHATVVDCRFGTVQHFPLIGQAVVLCDTGIRPEASELQALEQTARECGTAAQVLRAKALRSVDVAYLKANQSRLTPEQWRCVYHVVNEVQRVVFAERALEDEDHRQAGYYLSLSHESARDHWGNSCPEADRVVGLARGIPGCLGARMTGRGYGGAVLCWVAYHQVVPFVEALTAKHREGSDRPLEPVILQIVDGAG